MSEPYKEGYLLCLEERNRFEVQLAASEAQRTELEAENQRLRYVARAADDMARILEHEVMPRYMEMIDAFSLGNSVVDPMSRQALDAYRDARALIATPAAEITHGDGCAAAP